MDDPWAIDPGALDLSDDLRELIKPELGSGERLVWASRANRRSARDAGLGTHAGAAIWACGFLAVSIAGFTVSIGFPQWFRDLDAGIVGFSLIFGVIGFLVAIGTVASLVSNGTERRRMRGRTYALTDRRAIIWCPEPGSAAVAVHTFPRGSIKVENIKRTQYPDGSGNVSMRPFHEDPAGFLGVADVRRVEELIRRFLVDPGPDPTP